MMATPFTPPKMAPRPWRCSPPPKANRSRSSPMPSSWTRRCPAWAERELIAELRARTQACIYVVSGSNPPPQVTAAADGFLLKPFGVEALGKLLECGPPEVRAVASRFERSRRQRRGSCPIPQAHARACGAKSLRGRRRRSRPPHRRAHERHGQRRLCRGSAHRPRHQRRLRHGRSA